jgi:hypothetical protein
MCLDDRALIQGGCCEGGGDCGSWGCDCEECEDFAGRSQSVCAEAFRARDRGGFVCILMAQGFMRTLSTHPNALKSGPIHIDDGRFFRV